MKGNAELLVANSLVHLGYTQDDLVRNHLKKLLSFNSTNSNTLDSNIICLLSSPGIFNTFWWGRAFSSMSPLFCESDKCIGNAAYLGLAIATSKTFTTPMPCSIKFDNLEYCKPKVQMKKNVK